MSVYDFRLERLTTPTGPMLMVTDEEDRLRALEWEDCQHHLHRLLRRHYGAEAVRLSEASRPSPASLALAAYFDGDMGALTALPVATNGTAFQREVWEALRRIPVGETVSYRSLAARLGRPTAARAVGLANAGNPIAIVVPCHRVVGADAALTGYAGGLDRKRWLLAHEARGGQ